MAALPQIPGWVRGQAVEDAAKMGWFDRLAQWLNGYRFFVGSFTRDVATATGTQEVTGIPFRPSAVLFLAGFDTASARWSVGIDDGTTAHVVYSNELVTATSLILASAASIFLQSAAGNNYVGLLSVLGANGFTVSWTKTGLPTGTATIAYLAFR